MKYVYSIVLILFWVWICFFWLVDNDSGIIKDAKVIEKFDSSNDWEFVTIQWEIDTEWKVWDEFLKEWDYVVLKRIVEVYTWYEVESDWEWTWKYKNYRWVEDQSTSYYDYHKTWRENYKINLKNDYDGTHKNVPKKIKSANIYPEKVYIKDFQLDITDLSVFWFEGVDILKSILKDPSFYVDDWKYIFVWSGSYDNPEIWDMRISYQAVKPEWIFTVFWMQRWQEIVPYQYKWNVDLDIAEVALDSNTIYRLWKWDIMDNIKLVEKKSSGEDMLFYIFWWAIIFFWIIWLFKKSPQKGSKHTS